MASRSDSKVKHLLRAGNDEVDIFSGYNQQKQST
jgi:hypothetical protein